MSKKEKKIDEKSTNDKKNTHLFNLRNKKPKKQNSWVEIQVKYIDFKTDLSVNPLHIFHQLSKLGGYRCAVSLRQNIVTLSLSQRDIKKCLPNLICRVNLALITPKKPHIFLTS